MQPDATAPAAGHPRGLMTLFFTEMWERFSFYGMRGLLVLFMANQVAEGGMGFTDAKAGAVYGLYTMFVYLTALPGGWIADRVWGQRKAILIGGIIIAAGHFSMAFGTTTSFYLGLSLIVVGTGLLKPNVSTIVGDLYPEGGARRDAGFSIFYMGINLGAFLAPIACGFVAESSTFKGWLAGAGMDPNTSWHWAFGLAGIGMVMGLIQYMLTQKHLGDIGTRPKGSTTPESLSKAKKIGIGMAVITTLIIAAGAFGLFSFDPVVLAEWATYIVIAVAVIYFATVLLFGGLDPTEKRRVIVIMVLLAAAALFWSGFEQAASTLNLFADRHTDRMIFGWEMPTSWLQSVNAIFIIIFAPIFAALWVRLGARKLEPSSPAKFAWGLILLGLGFGVIYVAALIVVKGTQVLPTWLVLMYLFHTFGELCLSPVGLSTMTKLAPVRMVGQVMGLWFMATAFGNLIAGRIAGAFDPNVVDQMPQTFLTVTLILVIAGGLLALFVKPIKKLMGGIH